MINKIEYDYDEKTNRIVLPEGPPFDGKPVLIRLAAGWCEAWWDNEIIKSTTPDTYGDVISGWSWVCMDDDFQAELDEAIEWTELPK